MDAEIVVLRVLHIVAGVLWAGAAVFSITFVEPAFRAAGPETMRRIGPAYAKKAVPFMHVMGLSTIVFGFVLVQRTPGRAFDQLFTNGWGWAIGIGLIASVAGYAIGATGGAAMSKAMRIGKSIEGPPSADQVAQMTALQSRYTMFNRITAGLVIVAVGAMASARYV